ncbi:Oxidoreductase, short-chain dehydrogenase/reductase family [Roseibacterium elongatum DSM 19469]|uniref:Oxidoreductase, short-chain dehydrogenase/reductase family n=1 Tax=Roseicyclus elongatus DSM 19469 TaxID=1294273 RepID=W8S1A1_9RHOB|nr:SDR family NAD(P)-dependent oxidoreductase [Roseibacterium elongatum]AHM03907.1 Oxidoreductase, short-chain dehydrogenase/reductase family [Roseibacterium elongatum DSM 19469]
MGRSILITGSSSGIGHAAAHGLKARGWHVIASVRQAADVQKLRDAGFDSVQLDYADPRSVDQGLSEALELTGGRLDALFNNGAFGLPGAVEDLPRGALEEIFAANLFGVHDLTRRVIPLMRAQGKGRIVQHSSVLGYVTYKWRGAYVATKYALEGLTDTLRLEMRDTPLHIVTLNTGPVTSDLRVKSIPRFERWIDWENSARADLYRSSLLKRLYEARGPDPFELPPEAVVKKLVHALESPRPRARYYITAPAHIAAGLRRALPTRALDWVLDRG